MSASNPLTPSGTEEGHQYPNEQPRGGRGGEARPSPKQRDGDDNPGDSLRHSLKVSFDEEFAQTFRRSHSQLKVSFSLPPQDPRRPSDNRSPLIPYDVLSPQTRAGAVEPSFEQRNAELEDPSRSAMLIYPKRIDDLRRFRLLFVGLLLFIVSSTQGVHSLFGTILMQTVYGYSVKQMTSVYLCGSAFGMFVWPFGALYDWFGPRIVIAITTVLVALGELLFALMFAGHISNTVVNSCVFYAIMSWGCYGLDVVTLPSVLTHLPRNRGQPTGLLKTFSGLGSSLLSCLFRGFFNDHYDHLLWFMMAFTIVFGAIGTWYIEDAPYVVNRWRQRYLTPRKVLRNYLVRNRYMSQLIPRRRYTLVIIVMVLLNFYLTIQAVVVAYKQNIMTDGKKRGIAIGAIAVTLLLLILIIPIRAIDGLSPQDKEVIENAKRKEEELERRRAERRRQAEQEQADHFREVNRHASSTAPTLPPPEDEQESLEEEELPPITVEEPGRRSAQQQRRRSSDATAEGGRSDDPQRLQKSQTEVIVHDLEGSQRPQGQAAEHGTRSAPVTPQRSGDDYAPQKAKRNFSFASTWRRTEPLPAESRPVIEVHLQDEDGDEDRNEESTNSHGNREERPGVVGQQSIDVTVEEEGSEGGQLNRSGRRSANASPHLSASFAYAPHGRGTMAPGTPHRLEISTRDPSTYDKPYFETINICGEVYVTPVYQTSFFESLTYLDLWLIFYTTVIVWGVGLTMTANWNIQVMVQARWKDMDYKMYILIAAMSGVCTAAGRVFVGVYEQLLQVLREKCGLDLVPTLAYPLASVGLFVSMIFWIALPGDKVLVLAYILGPFFYGISTSFTPYVLGTIYDRDMGMHYGFIFFGAAIGQLLFFYCSWFLTYDDASVLIPMMGKRCIGQRKCMNKAIGIYIAVIFSSIFTSLVVHLRYASLVAGNLKHRRVIKYALKRVLGQQSSSQGSADEEDSNAEVKQVSGSSSNGTSDDTPPLSGCANTAETKDRSGRTKAGAPKGTNDVAPPRDDTTEAARHREPLNEDNEEQHAAPASKRSSRRHSHASEPVQSDDEA